MSLRPTSAASTRCLRPCVRMPSSSRTAKNPLLPKSQPGTRCSPSCKLMDPRPWWAGAQCARGLSVFLISVHCFQSPWWLSEWAAFVAFWDPGRVAFVAFNVHVTIIAQAPNSCMMLEIGTCCVFMLALEPPGLFCQTFRSVVGSWAQLIGRIGGEMNGETRRIVLYCVKNTALVHTYIITYNIHWF